MRQKHRVNDADGRKPNYFKKNLSQCCVALFPTNSIRKSQIEPLGYRTATKCVSKVRPHTCLLLKTVSNDTELSPSEVARSHLASTEFPQLLFKMNVHYRIHNSSPFGPILQQPNLAYIFLKNNRIRLTNDHSIAQNFLQYGKFIRSILCGEYLTKNKKNVSICSTNGSVA